MGSPFYLEYSSFSSRRILIIMRVLFDSVYHFQEAQAQASHKFTMY